MPALRVVELAAPRSFAVPDGLVFTSLNGIRLHDFRPGLAGLPVYTVGDHSARFAHAVGYRHVISASGNVADLARLIVERNSRGRTMLHLGALRPAGNLEAMLADHGIRLRRQAVYDVVENDLSGASRLVKEPARTTSIMIHSPRAAANVARWMERLNLTWRGEVICISEAAALPFRRISHARIRVALRPDEAAVLACLDSARTDRP